MIWSKRFGDEDELAAAGDKIRATAQAAQETMQTVAANIGGFFTRTFEGVIAGTTTFKDALLQALKAIAMLACHGCHVRNFVGIYSRLCGTAGS